MSIKRWAAKNRKSGNISRAFRTREAARSFKRSNGFRYAIVDLKNNMEVR